MSTTTTSKTKIKSGLIIYKSPRYSLARQNNTKYIFFSPKISFSASRSPKHLKKRLSVLPNKHYLHTISYNISPDKHENDYFVKYITRIHMIRQLSLVIIPKALESPTSEYKFKKIAKKILVNCSKITKLDLIIMALSQKHRFSLKYLNVLKSLKNLNCTIWTPSTMQIESLANYLSHTRTRHNWLQNPGYFSIITDPDMQKDFDKSSLTNSLEKINSIAQNSQLKLDYSTAPYRNQEEDLYSLTQKLTNVSNLTEFCLEIGPSKDLSNLFQPLQNNKHLKTLAIKYSPSPPSRTSPPPQTSFPKLQFVSEFLTTLDVSLGYLKDPKLFEIFTQELHSCTQLSALFVDLKKSESMNDPVLASFTKSLQKLEKLQKFTFNFNHALSSGLSQVTESGIQDFCAGLAGLQNLQELCLSFSDYKEKISDRTLKVLCSSLRFLTELQSLKLCMTSNNISGNGISFLSNLLPQLIGLHTLNLQLDGLSTKLIPASDLCELFTSFSSLQILSSLELRIKSTEIHFQDSRQIISSLCSLKTLNYLRFHLISSGYISEDLRQTLQQLEKKLEVYFSLNLN